MTGTVDRFEGNYVIVLMRNNTIRKVKICKIPPGVKEGDILNFRTNSIDINTEETQRRKKTIKTLFNDLFI